jgi:uncharacterized protein YdcH (DUF465 family)|tara:strand:- start:3550 stop:3765 length:216 start_codon:yes stop_codon:yes gene_type:complete
MTNVEKIDKLNNRLQSLIAKHKLVHEKVEVAEAEKVQEKFLVEMKKQKLSLKDEMWKINLEITSLEAQSEA